MHKISSDSFSLVRFYETRIRRIVPAYLFVLLITAVAVAFIFVRSDVSSFRKSLFWSILFNSNNHFASLDSYFGASSHENPLLHTWTLAVEMQFYFVLPLLLLFVKSRKTLVYILSVITVLLLGYSTYGIFHGKGSVMYFSLISRMPEFLIGVIAAVTKLRDRSFFKVNSVILSCLGLLIIVVCSVFYNEYLPFPGVTALIPCVGATLILVASKNKINDFLANKYLVYLGEISYSIYLWHWPIMSLLRYHNNGYEFSNNEKLFILIATVGASLVSYYLVERSLRKATHIKFYGPFVVLGGISCAMVVFVLTINRQFFRNSADYMYPSFGLSSHGNTFKKVGLIGDTTMRASDILLLGDSHALTMKKYFDILGTRNNFSVRTVTNDKYPTIPGLSEFDIDDQKLLNQYNKLIANVLPEIPKSKLILLQFTGDGLKWIKPLKSMLKELREDQKIIVIEDYPGVDKNAIRINKNFVKDKTIDQKYKITYTPISDEFLDFIDSDDRLKFVKLSFIDLFDDAPFSRDTLMYYDRAHLNVYGSTIYAMKTEAVMMRAIDWGISE